MAPFLANVTRMAQVARIFKLQHDDECACEACNAYEAATDEVEPESPAANREREMVAATADKVLTILWEQAHREDASGEDTGIAGLLWERVRRALAAPDPAGQREAGTSCEHGFSWDRSCDACGRIVSGLDEVEPE